jgi:hypothetical protein
VCGAGAAHYPRCGHRRDWCRFVCAGAVKPGDLQFRPYSSIRSHQAPWPAQPPRGGEPCALDMISGRSDRAAEGRVKCEIKDMWQAKGILRPLLGRIHLARLRYVKNCPSMLLCMYRLSRITAYLVFRRICRSICNELERH